MLSVLAAACAVAASGGNDVTPVVWLKPDGDFGLSGARLQPGTHVVRTPHGIGLSFQGTHSGVEFGDLPQFRLTHAMSVATYLNLDAYTNENNSAPAAQVLFRGDDRSGSDPYHLTVGADGTIGFGIEDGKGQGASISAPIPLKKWVHVLASYDSVQGRMQLHLDGRLVAMSLTKHRPLEALDPHARPGLGIGNVQAASGGAHNMPLHGTIADLRLYSRVVTPRQAGFALPQPTREPLRPWPPHSQAERSAGSLRGSD